MRPRVTHLRAARNGGQARRGHDGGPCRSYRAGVIRFCRQVRTSSGEPESLLVTLDDPAEMLRYRASLPGASGYDAAIHALRALPPETDELALLPLILPNSWMVNATATSRTFRAWRSPGGQQAFGAILTLLPRTLSLADWLETSDEERVAIRAGHHCAQPSLRRFGVESTVRPSFSIYNTHEEVARLATAVRAISQARPRSRI